MPESTSKEALSQSGENLRWTQFYKKVTPWCLGVFLVSLFAMWANALYSLFSKGGFKGIAGWLIWGIFYVAVRFSLLSAQLKKVTYEKDSKAFVIRLQILYWAAFFNLMANAVAIIRIVVLLSDGRLAWGKWDTVCSWVGGGSIILTVILWRLTKVGSQSVLAAGTRFFQQGSLALSPQLLLIPVGTLWGLLGVAGQQAVISFLVNRITVKEKHGGRVEAYAVLGVDVGNLLAAVVPFACWYYMS